MTLHGRVAADYLVTGFGGAPFTWGADLDTSTDELRSAYRRALQLADDGDIKALIAFARS